MPRRRSRRPAPSRPRASDGDELDFEWVLIPWDFSLALLASAWASLRAGLAQAAAALRRDKHARWFAVVFLFALVLRLWQPDWYGNRTFHPDERWIFDKAAELSYPNEPGKTDSNGMQYGSLPFYTVATVKDLVTHLSHQGAYEAVEFWGRAVTGCVDALTVLGVFLLALQLVGALPALLAALVIACAPLNIQLAHFFTVDPWLGCFATFTLAACVRLARKPSLGWSVASGVLYAAALASKSSGLPLVLPILLAHLWSGLAPGLDPEDRKAKLFAAGKGVAAAALATLAAFFMFMPWAFLNFSKFVANQTGQRDILVKGSPEGTPFVRQYWDTGFLFHLKNIVFFYLGLPAGLLALLAVPGMAALAALKTWKAWGPSLKPGMRPPSAKPARAAGSSATESASAAWQESLGPWLLLAWCLPYFLIVGSSFAKFARYMLPVLPTLAVLLALSLAWLRPRAPRLGALLAGLTLVLALGYGTGYLSTYFRPHPWLEASAWTYQNVPAATADPAAPGGQRPTRTLNEDWGDDLPVGVDGHNNNYYGLKDQPGQVNIVEPDSANKLDRMCTSLSQADVLFLADPRGYGTYLRIPYRFPLTHSYYRLLFEHPEKLGFALAHESQNPIRLFGLFPIPDSRIPSVPRWLWADESFTLYDRPHAYVFRRTAPMDPSQVRAALMDEVKALNLSDSFLSGRSPDQLQADATGVAQPQAQPAPPQAVPEGMLNSNFGRDRGAFLKMGDPVLAWWFLVSLLGLLTLPLTTRLFRGFPAGGYALSRALGVFLFGWLAYNLALLFPNLFPFWQSRLWLLLAAITVAVALGVRRRAVEAAAWFKAQRAEILFTEAVFAGAFLFFVAQRSLNPNIHDIVGQGYFGGGEPLGMTYLSAVTRCATFPAFDPWLTLANSSYYYFGYVLAATITKLSGFEPAITYNLSLALFFSLALLSAFGLLRALVSKRWLALGGALMVALAGSLWSVAYLAIQTGRGISPFSTGFLHGFIWDPTRFPELVSGHIFEFPFFSYLYGDLHPHNMVIGFSILLAALFLVPFLKREGGWRSFGSTRLDAALWLAVVAVLLDAQYAINTWSWPIFMALGLACALIGPWAGKKLGFWGSTVSAAWGLGFFVAAWFLGSHLLMLGFRHYFIQDGANRVGSVVPSEWQMSAYIPLAYYLPGLLALAALGGARLRLWGQGLAKPLGWDKLARKDWLDKSLTLNERLFRVRPLTYVLAATGLAVVALLLLVGTLGFDHSGVWAISLALGLSALGLFALGGYSEGGEAYLWVLGGCFCLMVAGVEFKFVADRMNTIFKVWMNGWVFMGLVFGAGLSTAFDKPAAEAALPPARTKARPKTKAKPRRVTPERFIPWAVALGTVVAVLAAAMVDAEGLSHGQRFIGSYLLFSLLLLAALGLGAWYGAAGWWRLAKQGLFYGLLALGLLYPLGAVSGRIAETHIGLPDALRGPHLDGMRFMGLRESRPGFNDKDYDRHDYALITWLNQNASVTETLVEAPGLELYKGYNRFSIYTGLPTLLGWDYQEGQQLGERTGGVLEQRKRDAAVIYGTDPAAAIQLLKQYHVRWIVVGSIERKLYPPAGLDKFAQFASVAAQDGTSVLYRFDWDKP